MIVIGLILVICVLAVLLLRAGRLRCPHCGSTNVHKQYGYVRNSAQVASYHCRACNREFHTRGSRYDN